MRTKILLGLLLLFCFGAIQPTEAAPVQQITLRMGKYKTLFKRDLTVKFVSVLNDSRCPEGVQCITAGNARIRIKVRKDRGRWKTFDINLNGDNSIIRFRKYEIDLVNLTPYPRDQVRISPFRYRATLKITG